MAAIAVVQSKVRPLNGAIVRRFPAGATTAVIGKFVYVHTDGTILLADATDTLAESRCRGIVVAIGAAGKTTPAVGDVCDVVTHGPVELGVSGVEGSPAFVSVTAGSIDQTAPAVAGNFPFAVGWFEQDTVLYVQPQVIEPTVVPA